MRHENKRRKVAHAIKNVLKMRKLEPLFYLNRKAIKIKIGGSREFCNMWILSKKQKRRYFSIRGGSRKAIAKKMTASAIARTRM